MAQHRRDFPLILEALQGIPLMQGKQEIDNAE